MGMHPVRLSLFPRPVKQQPVLLFRVEGMLRDSSRLVHSMIFLCEYCMCNQMLEGHLFVQPTGHFFVCKQLVLPGQATVK